MSRVGVVGIGHGRFGRRSDATVQELAFEAFRAALNDASIAREDLDANLEARKTQLAETAREYGLATVVLAVVGLFSLARLPFDAFPDTN